MKDLDAVVEVSSDIETDAGCFADNCRVICQGMIITDVEEELNSLIMVSVRVQDMAPRKSE